MTPPKSIYCLTMTILTFNDDYNSQGQKNKKKKTRNVFDVRLQWVEAFITLAKRDMFATVGNDFLSNGAWPSYKNLCSSMPLTLTREHETYNLGASCHVQLPESRQQICFLWKVFKYFTTTVKYSQRGFRAFGMHKHFCHSDKYFFFWPVLK